MLMIQLNRKNLKYFGYSTNFGKRLNSKFLNLGVTLNLIKSQIIYLINKPVLFKSLMLSLSVILSICLLN